MIAALLGYAALGVTQRHIHINEALRLAADRVADETVDILDGKATAARPPRRGARQLQESRETDQRVPQAES